MDKHPSSDIHALTVSEISRQFKMHSERRMQIVDERAELYKTRVKNGGWNETSAVSPDHRAAVLHAQHLLNGAAPASLSLPPEVDRDRLLEREQMGIDITLKILSDRELVARAAEAVEWFEAHRDEWCNLAREITLHALRLDALDRRARRLLEGCGDLFAVRLPMAVIVNRVSASEIPLDDLTAAALAEGICTRAEIKKASTD